MDREKIKNRMPFYERQNKTKLSGKCLHVVAVDLYVCVCDRVNEDSWGKTWRREMAV